MTLVDAVWASTTSLVCRFALAGWIAVLTLNVADSRRITLAWRAVLRMLVVASSVWGLWLACSSGLRNLTWQAIAWLICTCISVLAIVLDLAQWSRTPERIAHDEQAIDAAETRIRNQKPLGFKSSDPLTWFGTGAESTIQGLGAISCLIATGLAVMADRSVSSASMTATISHTVLVTSLWGVSIAVALELTVGGVAGGLLQVRWGRIANIAAWFFGIDLLLTCRALTIGGSGEDESLRVVAVALLVTSIVLGILTWVIPYRMARLRTSGRVFGQVSMALAAWVVVLSLAVVAVIPPEWVWIHLGFK